MGISVAKTTDAEAIAGLDDSKFLSPAKLRKALNANGGSPIFACRAWVNFNGQGTVAIRSSGNVSSITDNGVGDYAVNLINAIEDTNYSIVTNSGGSGSMNFCGITAPKEGTTPTTSSFRLFVVYTWANTAADCGIINAALFR